MNNQDLYMNPVSGDVATVEEWKADFESMGKEAWFGKEDHKGLHWLKDSGLMPFDPEEYPEEEYYQRRL